MESDNFYLYVSTTSPVDDELDAGAGDSRRPVAGDAGANQTADHLTGRRPGSRSTTWPNSLDDGRPSWVSD
jgi:hypothetical protein